ncbi:flagellar hook-length control protein FliK [Halobacillus sp. H74]|uniref:flagellar hook-length control protein FliK n=1 Tax=Halobacillus sp. H74 TaxID=3457436 RepID=UPI003FCC8820
MNPISSNLFSSPKLNLDKGIASVKAQGKDSPFQKLFSELKTLDSANLPEGLSQKEFSEELAALKKKLEQLMEKMENLTEEAGPVGNLIKFSEELLNNSESSLANLDTEKLEAIKVELENLKAQWKDLDLDTAAEESKQMTDLMIGVFDQLKILQSMTGENNQSSNGNDPIIFIAHPSLSGQSQHVTGKNTDSIENLHKLWQKFQQLVSPLLQADASTKLDAKTGTAIKDLLQQFSKLSESLHVQGKGDWGQLLAKVTKDGSAQEQKIFQQLMTTFQNRMNMPQSYHRQMPVTGKDIAKWVQQTVENNNSTEQASNLKNTNPTNQSVIPMTKVEQHVVHVNQNQDSSSSQKQLLQQFERILNSSRMLSNKPGSMEMQIKLRPANLGDLTVKFAQMNGEMAVKILVSSQAAKEMLEGNMSQLRHMFSPQQVVVEKSDALNAQHLQQEFGWDEEQAFDEQSGGQADQSSEHNEEPDEEELTFHELLMNEKA